MLDLLKKLITKKPQYDLDSIEDIKKGTPSNNNESILQKNATNPKIKHYLAKKELVKKYPYKSDHSNIPTSQGHFSVAESDIVKNKLILQLFDIFAKAAMDGKKSDVVVENIQMALSVYSSEVSFRRYIAFNRTNGTPLIIEKNGKELSATQICYIAYKTFLNDLSHLSEQPYFRYAIRIETYHKYSLQELLNFDGDTWHNHILSAKEISVDFKEYTYNEIHDTNVDDLLATKKLYAIYNSQECVVQDACSTLGFRDYVATVLYNDSACLVDIRGLSDIYEKEFYIEVKSKLFKVELVGKNTVIVEYNYNEKYDSYGFKSLDPRSFGPGWEVDVALIDSVKFKKKSILSQILKNLKN